MLLKEWSEISAVSSSPLSPPIQVVIPYTSIMNDSSNPQASSSVSTYRNDKRNIPPPPPPPSGGLPSQPIYAIMKRSDFLTITFPPQRYTKYSSLSGWRTSQTIYISSRSSTKPSEQIPASQIPPITKPMTSVPNIGTRFPTEKKLASTHRPPKSFLFRD